MNKNYNLTRTTYLWGHTLVYFSFLLIIIFVSNPFNESLIFWILLLFSGLLIVFADIIQLFPQFKIKDLENYVTQTRALIKILGYIIIFILFVFYPPGSPPTFIVPLIASLDYYLLLTAWWSLGILLVSWTLLTSFLNS
ncbi:MAG: hypothetical protein ACW981_05820 [Candidatus Hodarchaeales archaeon]